MQASSERCQYYYPDLMKATLPDARSALRLRRYWWTLKKYVWYISIIGFSQFALRILPTTTLGRYMFKKKSQTHKRIQSNDLNLQPGEWVEVRSAKEIFTTLDKKGKLKGLAFTPEMVEYCGKKFRVYKRLSQIIIEATGELRAIKSPTVLLEGVFCSGKAHGNCDRSCFCFWREAWLRRLSS